jgi:hypothetical protein
MKRILIGLCALSVLSGLALAPKAAAQSVTITLVGPESDNSYWVWNDEYGCWVWNGPEFQGDYEGHPYAYWHGRHERGGDRDHRPAKVESAQAQSGNTVQPKAEVAPAKEQPKTEVEKPKAQEKTEKPKTEQNAKAKPEQKKDDSKKG